MYIKNSELPAGPYIEVIEDAYTRGVDILKSDKKGPRSIGDETVLIIGLSSIIADLKNQLDLYL